MMRDGLKDGRRSIMVFNQPLISYEEVHRWIRVSFLQRMRTLLKLDLPRPDNALLARALYPQWQWAVRSGWREVQGGTVSFLAWLSTSLQAFLVIHGCSPLACLWPVIAPLRLNLQSKRSSLKTDVTRLKALVKRRF